MEEVWKDIPEYEGLYQISESGNVLSKKRNGTLGGILVKKLNRGGYHMVVLSKGNIGKPFTVHKLVALAFLDKPEYYECINHLDGNKTNNHYTNLEYTTILLNNRHAMETGLCKNKSEKLRLYRTGKTGLLNGRAKPIVQIDPATNGIISEFISATEAHAKTGICRQHISKCCAGSRNTSGGYFWKHKQ